MHCPIFQSSLISCRATRQAPGSGLGRLRERRPKSSTSSIRRSMRQLPTPISGRVLTIWAGCRSTELPRISARSSLRKRRSGPRWSSSLVRSRSEGRIVRLAGSFGGRPRSLMSDDIPFDRSFDLPPGKVEEIYPGVRRLLCNNPGPFTFKGTVSYIVGRDRVAVIDPGPLDEAHINALLNVVRGETITHILVTHTHRDHSPAAARIKAATGAPTLGEGPHRAARELRVDEAPRLDAGGDREFHPDIALVDGDVVAGDGWTLEAVATPGHTANHMAFALKDSEILFSGDHVMAWSTPVVAPPDGAMSDYMASLEKLLHRPEAIYLPGHGGAVTDAPRFVESYIRHRRGREQSILSCLVEGEADIPRLVQRIYVGLDPRLTRAAGLSVFAHLEDLVARSLVVTDGPPSLDSIYRLRG